MTVSFRELSYNISGNCPNITNVLYPKPVTDVLMYEVGKVWIHSVKQGQKNYGDQNQKLWCITYINTINYIKSRGQGHSHMAVKWTTFIQLLCTMEEKKIEKKQETN